MGSFLLILAALFSTGCVTIKRRHNVKKEEIRPQLDSNEEELLARYNQQARAVQTLQATVDLVPSTGTAYSGVIEEYHDVPGFILAERPATIRVIGQAPVVAKDIFDMVSDEKEFKVYVPSKNTFLVGPTALARPSNKPIENLRPQHVVEALFWPELTSSANVLFEQSDLEADRYYILTQVRTAEGGKLEIARKIWYDRSNLRVSRVQLYGPAGRLDSDIQYADWQPVATAPATEGAPAITQVTYARDIHMWRPQDDYKLEIKILKLTINEPIAADRFKLVQPEGTDLVRVGDEASGAEPAGQPGTATAPRSGSQTGSHK